MAIDGLNLNTNIGNTQSNPFVTDLHQARVGGQQSSPIQKGEVAKFKEDVQIANTGTGELSPKYSKGEHKLDIIA